MTVFVLPSGYLRVGRGVYCLCRLYHDYVFGSVVYVWCGCTMAVLVCLPVCCGVYNGCLYGACAS